MTNLSNADEVRDSPPHRRAYWITGIVQGVGFRPFVYRTAFGLNLTGFVRNQSGLVYAEVEGPLQQLDDFSRIVRQSPPPLAKVVTVRWQTIEAKHSLAFQIVESVATSFREVSLTPDSCVCAECLHELFDPGNRRYLYPFINCVNCGPRLTIVRGAPYDRSRTCMSAFEMCAACRKEYEDPANRRFHAQPIACPACGPTLQLRDNRSVRRQSDDPTRDFALAIEAGQIGALKGLGGYHLVCVATDELTVQELRRRKLRDEKPLAIMVADANYVPSICEVSVQEMELLQSISGPIVLLRRRPSNGEPQIARSVAPGNPNLGVILPYTPLHHMLMRALKGRPVVMTSGNLSDEPTAHDDQNAALRLGSIADLFLTHNRPIEVRCDDSVVQATEGHISMLRRSRGFAPEPLVLPQPLPQETLAVGGQLKSTFALGRDRLAFVSHHLGDLDHYSAYQAFERDLHLYERLFDMQVALVVHDLHPDYLSTRFAERYEVERGVRRIAVQHHHAHVASAMAEHALSGPVIGVAFDGSGYGLDGVIWGGEFLVATLAGFERVAHLRSVAIPGGDAAIRAPWRTALAHLHDANCNLPLSFANVSSDELNVVRHLIDRQVNAPLSSSMGRLFDAVSAIMGVRATISFEGQAAIELEFLADDQNDAEPFPFELVLPSELNRDKSLVIDTRPMIRAIAAAVSAGCNASEIASRFHSSVAWIIVKVCRWIRETHGLDRVVLTGGVFLNQRLAREATRLLSTDCFQVHRHSNIPCHDGGLSFGQLAIAAAYNQLASTDPDHLPSPVRNVTHESLSAIIPS